MSDLSILHRTTQYRGTHDAEVVLAVRPQPGETVEQLATRVLVGPADWLEIRVIPPLPVSL